MRVHWVSKEEMRELVPVCVCALMMRTPKDVREKRRARACSRLCVRAHDENTKIRERERGA
jgi:hypothetical protein